MISTGSNKDQLSWVLWKISLSDGMVMKDSIEHEETATPRLYRRIKSVGILMLMDCWMASGEKSACGRRSRMRGCERREPAQASTEDLDAVSIRVANLAGEIGDAGKGVCSVCGGEEIMVMDDEKDEERDGDMGEDGGDDTERRGDDNAGREAEGVMGVARMVLRVGTGIGGGMERAREEVEEVCVKKGDEPASAFDIEAFGAYPCNEIPFGADEGDVDGDKDNESAGMDGDDNDFDEVASGRGDCGGEGVLGRDEDPADIVFLP
jgi:hypothetical protein